VKVARGLRITLAILAAILLLLVITVASIWVYFHPQVKRVDALVYGQRRGHDLTLDVVQPAKPNGFGVLLMVSSGWKSAPQSFQTWMGATLLRRGYTIFAVYHVSQPEATVMEIAEDVNRAVRYVRHNARRYGVEPQRLGVTGGSAGGHLSLLLATRGAPGPAGTADPLEAETSAVQAVAIFYPVTDLLNLGASTENLHDGGPPKSFVKGFGPNSTNPAVWKVIGHDLSPIYYLTTNLPPTLIYHGDADTLVPLDQSERFQAEARKLGRTVELVVHHGGRHGWLTMLWDIRRFADWFDKYLPAPAT
jgi:acetyl esterase/lipase